MLLLVEDGAIDIQPPLLFMNCVNEGPHQKRIKPFIPSNLFPALVMACEPVWPSGRALGCYDEGRLMSVRFHTSVPLYLEKM